MDNEGSAQSRPAAGETGEEVSQRQPNDRLRLGFYFVAILDILGQGAELGALEDAFLRQLSGRTEADAKAGFGPSDEVVTATRNTFGYVMVLQQALQRNFDMFNSAKPDFPLLPPEKQKIATDMWNFELKLEAFADTVVVYVSLRDPRLPIAGVNMALLSCCGATLNMLAHRKAIRGGVDVGVAGTHGAGHLYGPALARAHYLEAKVAQYPRVVVGDGLMLYLHQHSVLPGQDDNARVTRWIAQRCLELVSEDTDGIPILDYLGKGFKQSTGLLDVSNEVEIAGAFANDEFLRWRREGNVKLAAYCGRLRHYFRTRVGQKPGS